MASELEKRSGGGSWLRVRDFLTALAFLERAGEVARQRRALLELGDAALKDFGASRADAWNEAARPWWDLPEDC